MSALKPAIILVSLLLVLAGCSADSTEEKEGSNKEQLPKVDASKFRKYQGDGFTIQLLKEMSINTGVVVTLLEADYLPKEYHLEVKAYPNRLVLSEPSCPKDPKKQLEWFAKTESNSTISKARNVKAEKLVKTMVDDRPSFKRTIHGVNYGLPKRKTVFLRYYQTKNAFVRIAAWTTSENAEAFEPLAQYMGMTLKIN